MGSEGTPNILLHPQFQFSRNMPDRGTVSTSTVSSGDPPPLRAAINLYCLCFCDFSQQSRAFPDNWWAPRKISSTFHFWQKSFTIDDVQLAELSNFWIKQWHFRGGGQNIFWPPTYFQGSRPQPPRSTPWPKLRRRSIVWRTAYEPWSMRIVDDGRHLHLRFGVLSWAMIA